MKKHELLAPAGSMETFRAVIRAGADAVYVGGNMFGARAYAENFTEEELLEAIDFAHLYGRKVYLTVNTLMKNQEISARLYEYLLPLYERGLDAVLVQDFGALAFIRQAFPGLAIHASTQMTVTGAEGVRFLQRCGVERVVMAREVSISEMKQIHEETGMELEAFVHGAMCYCYSGQCLFSSMLGGRSGNRGRCAQPCRLPYSLPQKGEMRQNAPAAQQKEAPRQKDAVLQADGSGSYVLSMKDLCGLEQLPELLEAGVYSLKIEGRMKQAVYAAGVVSIYRKYLDEYLRQNSVETNEQDLRTLAELGNRCGFTDEYYYAHNGKGMVTFQKPNYEKKNEALQEEIRIRYVDTKSAIAVAGEAVFHKGKAAVLRVKRVVGREQGQAESRKDDWMEVAGAVVEPAKKMPVSADELKSRLQKTGDSLFVFETLDVDAEPDIFIPNGAVNQLRRAALGQLQEQLLAGFRRDGRACHIPTVEEIREGLSEAPTHREAAFRQETNQNAGTLSVSKKSLRRAKDGRHYIAAVSTREQLRAVMDESLIDTVYLETVMFGREGFSEQLGVCIGKLSKNRKQVYLCLPVIFRRETSMFYGQAADSLRKLQFRGFVVRNYEELEWVLDHFPEKEIVADHGLYTYNDYAKTALHAAGIVRDTIPLELNRSEILHRDNADSEAIVYGYYPLMVSAQCVRRNCMACDKHETVTYLRDRYQKKFPVRNYCSECYNIIYNSLPTQLLAKISEMGSLSLRLNFTIEDRAETEQTLQLFHDTVTASRGKAGKIRWTGMSKYTNGHYNRGVE